MSTTTATGTDHWVDIDGPTHYRDYGGPQDGPLIVCVHGLGGSALNWDLVAPHLTHSCRVLALDLPGHGLTEAGHRSTSVHANQHLIHRFLTEVTGSPAILMGNSMGGLLAVVQATSAPRTTSGVVLIAPALPAAGFMVGDLRMVLEFAVLATPGIGSLIVDLWTRLATAEQQVTRMLRVVTVDPAKLPREALDAAITQAEVRRQFRGTARHLVEAARSVVLMSQGRNYVKRLQALATPVLLIHGGRDRIVSARSAHAAASRRPEWTFHLMEDVGHVPQIQEPEGTAQIVLGWLAENPEISQQAALA
ncbi:MAG: alpha/beta hydrolase [Actinobacteria bacterium]|nr:alpha/beta hydrolase [Actinomycetota bacterium]MCB9415047.1 alpha/beta hydrolase [Actinomycetota bacterium]HRY10183.1 alpha/beta hydrolase [Candidatus Nanopelagicales bacterium]